MRLLLSILIGYLAALLVIYMIQDRFLYFPVRYSPESLVSSAKLLSLDPWPGGAAGSYRGLLAVPATPEIRGTVVIFHGNAGTARDRTYFRDALVPLGWRVLLAEYPGYGPRKGRLGEASFTADALETLRLARERFPGPVYVWGESLGCAVAAAVAREGARGAALVTPWADLPRLAQAVYPFLPARWLTRDTYDNIASLKTFAGPVAVIMAGNDEIIPAGHTRRLFDSIRGPKRLWVLEGAGHNSWPGGADESWWAEVTDFLSSK